MDDLVAFLRARLDEDEAAIDQREHDSGQCDYLRGVHLEPTRALADVAFKRAILDRHTPHETAFHGLACNWCSEDVDDRPQLAKEPWPCPDVRTLAAVYSGHPDCRPEWKP